MARRRWTAKQREGWRRRYLGDLKHMHRCCVAGRLPREHAEYLTAILSDNRLPQPKEVAKRVQLTYEQQRQNKLFTIPPIDKTEAEIAKLRKARDRERKRLARRKARQQTREAYLATVASNKPWLKEVPPISRRTWFRRQAKGRQVAHGTRFVQITEPCGTGFVRA